MRLAFMRRVPSALYFSLLLTLYAPFVPAQSSTQLSGRVTDPNNAGISGAAVTLIARDNRLRTTAMTAGDGSYRFERVAAGDYLLEASAAGFAKTVKAVSIKPDGERLDIALDVAAINADGIVTAAGTAQSGDEASKALTGIEAQHIH